MMLDVTNTAADPPIPADIKYPFDLKASDTQKAALTAYFNAKWSCLTTSDATLLAYCGQMAQQIAGTAPFFYLQCAATMADCTLIDGFTYGLSASATPLRIDNDYPTGTYRYTGDLNGLSAQVKMKVYRA